LRRALPTFDRDRWRDRELLRAGYTTLRVPWRHPEEEPEAVLDAIRVRLSLSTPTK
jgi:very-short-patch-repair endonuclease